MSADMDRALGVGVAKRWLETIEASPPGTVIQCHPEEFRLVVLVASQNETATPVKVAATTLQAILVRYRQASDHSDVGTRFHLQRDEIEAVCKLAITSSGDGVKSERSGDTSGAEGSKRSRRSAKGEK